MNPMLKIAYDYGCHKAVEDFEKSAGTSGLIAGALKGGTIGAMGAGLTAEREDLLKRLLIGAAGGALLGGAIGNRPEDALDFMNSIPDVPIWAL
jgi:hypothetical protein